MIITCDMYISEIKLPMGGFREVILKPTSTPAYNNLLETVPVFEFEPTTTLKVTESYVDFLSIGMTVKLALEWQDPIGAVVPALAGAVEDGTDNLLFPGNA